MRAALIDTRAIVLATTLAVLPFQAGAKPPLSASDWLSGSVQTPGTTSAWRPGDQTPPDARSLKRSDLAKSGSVEPVGVTRLGEGNPDSTGTVSARAAGLPKDLWGSSDGGHLAQMVRQQNPHLPALRRLLRRVLAAQFAPPPVLQQADEGALFLARADKLLDMGATGAAQELLQAAGPNDPERFRRLFDIALLGGNEARACQTMDRTPGIAPSFAARIFCLAFNGDWPAAALVYTGAEYLGKLDPDTATLMAYFLDDGYSDSTEALAVPKTITPLTFRLLEAIGQPLSSNNLPIAFALSDLDDNGGWKAQLDAAERLARVGAIPASQLRQIYLLQQPAASGGVWSRAAALQKLMDALVLRDKDAVTKALPIAYATMNTAGLGNALADMAGAETANMQLEGRAGQIAMWLALAADQAHTIQTPPADASEFDRWLISFAIGKPATALPAQDGDGQATILAPAFEGDPLDGLSVNAKALIDANKKGEALLNAITDVDAGVNGDFVRAAAGMRVLRALGQEEIARQAAVELMLAQRVSGLR